MRAVARIALVVLLAIAGAGAWATHVVVRHQENLLLQERAAEVGLALTSAVNNLQTSLSSLGAVLQASGNSMVAFDRAAVAQIAGNQTTAVALVSPAPGGYRVVDAAGPGLVPGQLLTGVRADTLRRAASTPLMVPTPVIGSGDARQLGIALGPPAAPAGTLLYRQSALGPVKPPRQASTAPFAELNVVIYASPHKDPTQVLAATGALPLPGPTHYQALPAGAGRWLLGASAKAPLVGSVAANAQWFVLAVGALGAALMTVMVEAIFRRRDIALALYASEHQMAARLQRSLLPELPELDGVELAARYLAGGEGQQVGGDWFDAFPLAGGAIGIVVGDVVGHDIAAATSMSQVRSALRAYAWEGEEPALVLERLERLVDRFSLTQLVTILYGVLSPPDVEGNRTLRYANAGHLPPLLHGPDGTVQTLDSGGSVVIGAPNPGGHAAAVVPVPTGSTLLLYTDGLVELPGRLLDETLGQLVDLVAAHSPTEGADGLVERVLSVMPGDQRRDDVALLAVKVLASPRAAGAGDAQPPAGAAAARPAAG